MQELIEWLKGKKTYIIVVLGIVCYGLKGMGIITPETFNAIATIAAMLGLGFLRAGIKNSLNTK